MKKFTRIYIAGALTHTSEEQKQTYEEIAKACREFCDNVYIPHLGGTDPLRNPEVTAREVWERNHKIVSKSDLIIAYVGEPSLGVGAELEIARAAGKKLILWWRRNEKASRMARGNPAAIALIEGSTIEEISGKIRDILENL
jgi:nucleoside 2-deoxyribosyltransferase